MIFGDLLDKVLSIPAILIAFTFHEYAHAKTADLLGDKTPKLQGRLTLNPFTHIDILGFIMILVFRFGWAKPVQTNPSAYKNYYKDDLKVSIAGPLANLVIAFIFTGILALFLNFVNSDSNVFEIIYVIIYLTISINCMLFFLNLIPIPGFDGFHVIRDIFPKTFHSLSGAIYRYQFVLFMVLILPILPGGASVFTYIVGYPAQYLQLAFFKLVGLQ